MVETNSREETTPNVGGAKPIFFYVKLVLAVLAGLYFIFSGAVKIAAPSTFFGAIMAYQLFPQWLARAAVVLLPAGEMALGTALLIGAYRRLAAFGLIALLLFFISIVIYAIVADTAKDCGCLGGVVVRTPFETLIEDIVLLAMVAPAVFAGDAPLETRRRLKAILATVGYFAFVAVGLAHGSARDHSQGKLAEGVYIGNLSVAGFEEPVNLAGKTYLVEFFSVTCPHCQRAVSDLNGLRRVEGLPPIIAVCPDIQDPEDFVELTKPEYPVGVADAARFGELVKRVPKFCLVRAGTVRRVFEGIPSADEIRRAVKAAGG